MKLRIEIEPENTGAEDVAIMEASKFIRKSVLQQWRIKVVK